jgi:hypothetical protein
MPGSGALSDLISPALTLVCAVCDRRGRYSVARLQDRHGDATLTDLRRFLTANCPKRDRFMTADQCEAVFDPPPETRRERPRGLNSAWTQVDPDPRSCGRI